MKNILLIAAALSALSVSGFAAGPSDAQAKTQTAQTEQICVVHPEYSCVEVPTAQARWEAKQAKMRAKANKTNDADSARLVATSKVPPARK